MLTGLPNRRLFQELIRFELEEAHRNRQKMELLFLDLDRFKKVNDTLGHEAGDELLKTVAIRLRSAVRKADAVARIGGDEFSILLPGIERSEDISEIVWKIMGAFQEKCLLTGREFRIMTSMGISVYPDDSDALMSSSTMRTLPCIVRKNGPEYVRVLQYGHYEDLPPEDIVTLTTIHPWIIRSLSRRDSNQFL